MGLSLSRLIQGGMLVYCSCSPLLLWWTLAPSASSVPLSQPSKPMMILIMIIMIIIDWIHWMCTRRGDLHLPRPCHFNQSWASRIIGVPSGDNLATIRICRKFGQQTESSTGDQLLISSDESIEDLHVQVYIMPGALQNTHKTKEGG